MLRFALFFALIFLAPSAMAASPPVPPSKKDSLDLQKKLQTHEREKEELESKARNIETDLDSTRGRLVDVGKSIQKNERSLQALESRIDNLEKEKTTLESSLEEDRKAIARLILALERIERVPPEALIARPGAPLRTAQSAMLMRDIMPTIQRQAAGLKLKLASLHAVSEDLEKQRERMLTASDALKKEQDTLAELAAKREQLYASAHTDIKERQEEIKKISLQARNLQDLVARLDAERRAKAEPAAKASSVGALPAFGHGQLPISGIIRVRYDEPDAFGAPSKGLTIEGRPGALVVAPLGGTIRFSGPFRNYGNMLILEHKGGFHSLIAGLEKIDTVVGQAVSAGEPLGSLGGAGGERPTLYYELRQKGQPVNPSQKFADLG